MIFNNLNLVVVDSPVEGDHRVQKSILEGDFSILDINANNGENIKFLGFIFALNVVFLSLIKSIFKFGWAARNLAARKNSSFFSGISPCVRWVFCALRSSSIIKDFVSKNNVQVIHAHDLYCALSVFLAIPRNDLYVIYDSHELQIHRNRQAGWLRILVEHGIEQYVLRRASEIRVVNLKISNIMREWFDININIRVLNNDFYEHFPLVIPPNTDRPGIVYVGKGVAGRKLEVLDFSPDFLGFDVYVYFLGEPPPNNIKGLHWFHGPINYESDLRAVTSKRRCLMWCCLETSSLSYQLATPNKFFQALAMGIPVIASRGSYLAEIVEEHKIGVVFDGAGLADMAAIVSSPVFETWVENVGVFRDKLRNGLVVI